jgi:hypothetical protein
MVTGVIRALEYNINLQATTFSSPHTSRYRAFPAKFIVARPLKKVNAFKKPKFITVFTKPHHWTIS